MTDNQELTEEELCACPQPDWMGSYDGLMCGRCRKFCSADARAIKEAESKKVTYPKNCCKEYAEHLETTYSGYSLHEKLLNETKEQLTQTQQALDRAVEALEKVIEKCKSMEGDKEFQPYTYKTQRILEITEAALASIKE